MRKKSIAMCAIGVLITISLVALYSLFGASHQVKESKDVQKGLSMLTQLAKQSVKDVQSKIDKANDAIAAAKEPVIEKEYNYVAHYQNTMILGDSVAEAFLNYGILPSNYVLAEPSRRVDQLDDYIQTTINAAPTHIFMEYGLNDISYYRENVDNFISIYESKIQTLMKALPDTKMYIIGIAPVTKAAIAQNSIYGKLDVYNEALEKMCDKLQITYIDAQKITDWNDPTMFDQDGIHPAAPYYYIWLQYMAGIAGI